MNFLTKTNIILGRGSIFLCIKSMSLPAQVNTCLHPDETQTNFKDLKFYFETLGALYNTYTQL